MVFGLDANLYLSQPFQNAYPRWWWPGSFLRPRGPTLSPGTMVSETNTSSLLRCPKSIAGAFATFTSKFHCTEGILVMPYRGIGSMWLANRKHMGFARQACRSPAPCQMFCNDDMGLDHLSLLRHTRKGWRHSGFRPFGHPPLLFVIHLSSSQGVSDLRSKTHISTSR